MRLAVSVLAFLLVASMAGAAFLILQSCAVRVPFYGLITFCEDPAIARTRAELERKLAQNDEMAGEIAQLERDLALLACKAEPPAPPPPPPPEPQPAPETPSGLQPDAFDENDISIMEGCWRLTSDYRTRDRRTGRITQYNFWQICFDANGNGSQIMRATNGTECRGNLTGSISGGSLTMREPGNLRCSDGSYVYRRNTTCSVDAQGNANCQSHQPETNGRGSATLRRAGR